MFIQGLFVNDTQVIGIGPLMITGRPYQNARLEFNIYVQGGGAIAIGKDFTYGQDTEFLEWHVAYCVAYREVLSANRHLGMMAEVPAEVARMEKDSRAALYKMANAGDSDNEE